MSGLVPQRERTAKRQGPNGICTTTRDEYPQANCFENLCNTEENFCHYCNLNKTMDICSDYSAVQPDVESEEVTEKVTEESTEEGTEEDTEGVTEGVTEDVTAEVTAEVTEVRPDVESEGEPEEVTEVNPDVESEEESEEVPQVKPDIESEEIPEVGIEDSKEENGPIWWITIGGTSDASNQLIPHVWFFVSILSSLPNPINFRWIHILFNPLWF